MGNILQESAIPAFMVRQDIKALGLNIPISDPNPAFLAAANRAHNDIKILVELIGERDAASQIWSARLMECISESKGVEFEYFIEGLNQVMTVLMVPIEKKEVLIQLIPHKSSESADFFRDFNALLVECTSLIIQSSPKNFHERLDMILSKIGRFSDVDRSYFFKFDHEDRTVSNINEWCNDGVDAQINELQGLPYEMAPNWMAEMLAGRALYINNLDALDENWAPEKEMLGAQGILSLLSIPIREGEFLYGFIGFDAVKQQVEWSDASRALLHILADNIGSVIRRNEQNEVLIQSNHMLEDLAQKANEANKAKSEFLANMSHEIRTPLNGVIGFGELLKTTELNETQKQYVDYLNVSAGLLMDLINQILDFSKIEAGKMQLSIEPVNLPKLIESAMSMVQPMADNKKVKLLITVDRNLPEYVQSDAVRLLQVIINLLNNAVKFTEKGSVTLTVMKGEDADDGMVHIDFSIRDTGIGITEEQKQRLFTAFGQADSSTSKKYGGSGLGLVIAHNLLQLMGSAIQLESVPGMGSHFYFSLRMTEHESPKLRIENDSLVKTPDNRTAFGKRALIVEDNDLNLQLMKALLSQIYPGYLILEARNGFEALEIVAEHQPDFILMDVQMPEMDGRECTRTLRANGYKNPIVACTANAVNDEREKCLEAGMDDYIPKPFSKENLKEVMDRNVKSS